MSGNGCDSAAESSDTHNLPVYSQTFSRARNDDECGGQDLRELGQRGGRGYGDRQGGRGRGSQWSGPSRGGSTENWRQRESDTDSSRMNEEVIMSINCSDVGKVIGKGGSKIQELEQESRAKSQENVPPSKKLKIKHDQSPENDEDNALCETDSRYKWKKIKPKSANKRGSDSNSPEPEGEAAVIGHEDPTLMEDILICIFGRLPIADLGRCANVCRTWAHTVQNYTSLWENKNYSTAHKPRESTELRMILYALPPLKEIKVRSGHFFIHICYPYLNLQLPETEVVEACQSPYKNLLGIFGYFLREYKMDTTQKIARLRVLDIEHSALNELVFLELYADVLNKVKLKNCNQVPSSKFCSLRHLRQLQSLSLNNCKIEPIHMNKILRGMRWLACIRLEVCRIPDVSALKFCENLRDVFLKGLQKITGMDLLPAGLRTLELHSYNHAAEDLLIVLPRLKVLQVLQINYCELSNLNFLESCTSINTLRMTHCMWADESEVEKLRYLTHVHVLELVSCRLNDEILTRVMPYLTELHTLVLSRVEVHSLKFLHECRNLRTLTLYSMTNLDQNAYLEVAHLEELQTIDVSPDIRPFVCRLLSRSHNKKVIVLRSN